MVVTWTRNRRGLTHSSEPRFFLPSVSTSAAKCAVAVAVVSSGRLSQREPYRHHAITTSLLGYEEPSVCPTEERFLRRLGG